MKLDKKSKKYIEFEKCIDNLSTNEKVHSMNQFVHHGKTTCLDHSMTVSYLSYTVCKKFGFDYTSAARGGLLHDFYLYDWHIPGSHKGLHGFNHPKIALTNSQKYFSLNKIEIDIIQKHMWPLTYRLPKYKESYIVSLVDKYCSFIEIIQSRKEAIFSRS